MERKFTLVWLIAVPLSMSWYCQGKPFLVSRVECKTLDPSFCFFKKCEMTTNESGQAKFHFHIAMRYKKPVNDVTTSVSLFKISKTYRLPIFNESFDFCAFMHNRSSSKVFAFIATQFEKFSNINHTCPYQHDIIVRGVDDELLVNGIPAPNGKYMLNIRVAAYQKWKADLQFYAVKQN
ncbi:hypothetical protein KR222_005761 [Zaprionus bogoriensis]|nr:hypothetical protein KR222_005761 [Zaprionus bogoriensis]